MLSKKYFIWIFFAFFFGLSILNSSAHAQEVGYFTNSVEGETECGVSGSVVAPKSFSICKEDLSYNILYMIFAKVFNEYEILKAFVYEDAGQLDNVGYAGQIGASILAILLGFSQVVLIVGSIVLSYSTVKVLVGSMTSGEFLGKGVQKIGLVLRTLFVIFLLFPIGSISIAQLVVLMGALLSIMGANFFYGLFLNQVQVDSFEAEGTDNNSNSAVSINQSNTMIQASLCQNRTIKAIRNQNFKKYDDYFFTDLDFEDQIKRVANCIAPEIYFQFAGTSMGANDIAEGNVTSLSFGKKEMCNTTTGLLSEYNVEYHGYPFSCGSLSFSHPTLDHEINTSKGDSANTGIFDSLEGNVSGFVNQNYGSYDLASKLASYYQKAAVVKTGGDFDFSTLQSDVDSYAGTLKESAVNLYNTVKGESDHNTGVKALYVSYAILYNNLLGAKSANGEKPLNVNNMVWAPGAVYEGASEIRKQLNDKYAMKQSDAIALLEKYSSQAASNLDSMHCLQNFRKVYQSTKKTIQDLQTGAGKDFEDYEKVNDFYGECLWFSTESALNPRYNNSNAAIKVGDSTAIITMGAASNLVNTFDPSNPGALAAVQEQEALNLALDAQANKMALAAHFYVVRAAIEQSFLEALKEVSDKEIPQKMRKQGWAGFGGYIIQIASNQTNASRYINRINSGVNWSSFNENNGIGMFINYDAFNSSINANTLGNPIPFTNMVLSSYFSAGNSTTGVMAGTVSGGKSAMSEDDTSVAQSLLFLIEDSLTRPMKYLKKMGGLDQNVPLREGVEKCFKEGNCFAGEIHPVNALAYMGSDLLTLTVEFYVVKAIFNGLDKMISSVDGSGSTSNNSGIFGKLKQMGVGLLSKLATVGVLAIKIINAVLNALSPLFFLLLMLGLFFGYIVPMMPYISFLVLFLGWLILIFQLLIAVPIWLIMLAIPGPTGESRGNLGLLWQYTGQLVIRPSLMVIGMIFGWFLASVSIYFINLTFFGVMGPVVENTGTFMGIVDVIMFYMAYLVIVFVALKHSFSIITSFPDAVSKAIDLKGVGDASTHNSLQADNLLKAVIMTKMFQAIQGVSNEIQKESNKGKYAEREKQETLRDIRNEVGKRFESQNRVDPSGPNNKGEDLLSSTLNEVADLGKKVKDGLSDPKRPDNGDKT